MRDPGFLKHPYDATEGDHAQNLWDGFIRPTAPSVLDIPSPATPLTWTLMLQ